MKINQWMERIPYFQANSLWEQGHMIWFTTLQEKHYNLKMSAFKAPQIFYEVDQANSPHPGQP